MTLRRHLIAGLFAAALVAAPVSPVVAAAQPGNCCCPPGQTGVIYGCSSFCVDGKALDTSTGLCVPVPPPYPHPPVTQ
nr:hypothetical protein [Mycolicibacterium komanii]CRL72073.1 hypothetical protein CPGR_02683 [Mycolicibacterium komanii]